MVRKLCVSAFLIAGVFSIASVGAAQSKRLEFEFGLGGAYFDNFFQAPDDAEQENVSALTAEFELVGLVSQQRPLKAYGRARVMDFNKDLPTASQFTAGLVFGGERHYLDTYWRHDNNRPSITVGDEFDVVDGDALSVDYGFRINRDWEIGGEGMIAQEDFSLSASKESDLWRLGASVRYRGFGSKFSPETGLIIGERDVIDPNEDYDQTDYYLKFRFVPLRRLYLSLRIRYRLREYAISEILASNFDREDDRTQLALTGTYTIRSHWAVNLYATYVDADSTKPSRIFNSTLAMAWLSYRF